MNQHKEVIADTFIIQYAQSIQSENKVAESMAFTQLILQNITDFFNYE